MCGRAHAKVTCIYHMQVLMCMLVPSHLSAQWKWGMASQFNNYVWQGGYFPSAVQPAPQFPSTCSSLQPQPVNPGPSHNPSSLHQYVPPHTLHALLCPSQPPSLQLTFIWRFSIRQIKGSFNYVYHVQSITGYWKPWQTKVSSFWTVWWSSAPNWQNGSRIFSSSKKKCGSKIGWT